MSTFKAPSKRREAVKDEVICAMMRFKLVYVGRSIEATAAHVVNGLVVQAEGHISVLQQGVGGKDVIVRLDDSSGNLRGRGHGVRQLGLLAVVDGQTLQKKSAKTGA